MTRTGRTGTIALMATLSLAGTGETAFAGQTELQETFARAGSAPGAADAPVMARLRSSNAAVAAVIRAATEQSATFRGLADAINGSDGIVYVEAGTCGHGVRACLALSVTKAGPNRLLRVVVDTNKVDWDLMGSIGHELQHAIEVLSTPSVTTTSALYFFYEQARPTSSRRFETEAAVEAGNRVRAEVRRNAGN